MVESLNLAVEGTLLVEALVEDSYFHVAEPDRVSMVLNCYVTGETLPVEWQVYKLAGSDTGVPIGATQFVGQQMFIVHPMFDVTVVNNQSSLVPLADRARDVCSRWMNREIATCRRNGGVAVWVPFIVENLKFRSAVPGNGALLGDTKENTAVASFFELPFEE